jgi:hypothetical protein
MTKLSSRQKLEKLLTTRATLSPDEVYETGEFGGRNVIYDACSSGEIENFRFNKRIFIPTAPLRRKLGLEVG